MKAKTIAAVAVGAALVFGATYRGGVGQLTDDLGFCLKTAGDICTVNAGDLRVGLHPAERIRALFAGATQLPFVEADIKEAVLAPVVPAVRPVTVGPVESAVCQAHSESGRGGVFPCHITRKTGELVPTLFSLMGYDQASDRAWTFTGTGRVYEVNDKGQECLANEYGVVCVVN